MNMPTSVDSSENTSRQDNEMFVPARTEEELRDRLHTEKSLEEIRTLMESQEGKEQLLAMIKEANPELNGNVESAVRQVRLNTEQLQKKEGFFKRLLSAPKRMVEKVWETIKKHPFITALVILALILKFLPWGGTGFSISSLWDRVRGLFSTGSAGAATEAVSEAGASSAAGSAADAASQAIEAANLASEAMSGVRLGIVDRSVFLNGVEYLTTDTTQMEKLAEVLKGMKDTTPDIIGFIKLHENARQLALEDLNRVLRDVGVSGQTLGEFLSDGEWLKGN